MSEVKAFVPRSTTAPASASEAASARSSIAKTYKLYINGSFTRSESGRTMQVSDAANVPVANICLASRKDLRDAVAAGRNATSSWCTISAYLRGQILYRIAEMLESRRLQFKQELEVGGVDTPAASRELDVAIDRLVHYAGWTDKFQQLSSSTNPVASSHFVFTVPEALGVVAACAVHEQPLLAMITQLAITLCSGNTLVLLAPDSNQLIASTLAEVLHTADVPAGVVSILTGNRNELLPQIASHQDIDCVFSIGASAAETLSVKQDAALTVKRTQFYPAPWLTSDDAESYYPLLGLSELKTTWHPVGR